VREKMPQATLNIVGPREVIKDLPDLPGLFWHGYLDKSQPDDMMKLGKLLREASLFVMPSLYEPFGIAPLEAMAYEIPCVVSDAWALPEIVPDGICGRLVRPGDHEQLADVLLELLSDHSLLDEGR
jgi:starch synthase